MWSVCPCCMLCIASHRVIVVLQCVSCIYFWTLQITYMASVTWEHLYQWHIVCVCACLYCRIHIAIILLSFLQVSNKFTVLSEMDYCVCVYVRVCGRTCLHLCIYAFVCVCVCTCTCVHVCVYMFIELLIIKVKFLIINSFSRKSQWFCVTVQLDNTQVIDVFTCVSFCYNMR